LLSRWNKLIEAFLAEGLHFRFEDLYEALVKIGYTPHQPHSGSSHYTFRKPGCMPITIPKQVPLKRKCIEWVAEAVCSYLEEDQYE
jgi:hypothetical protein